MEAMKMEHRMEAPANGVVDAVHANEGDVVELGFNLLDFTPE
jgi:biotin carboxyl carrier protein